MDPYEILGLQKNVNFTLEELKDKYKAIAIKVHPDKGGSEQLFLLVTNCYKKLVEEYYRRVSDKDYLTLKAEFKKVQAAKSTGSSRGGQGSVQTRSAGKFDLDRFNQVFSENKLENAYDKGYESWMSDKQIEDLPKPKGSFNLDKFNSEFSEKNIDKKNKYIVKYKEPEPLMASKKISFTELGEVDVDDFSGDNISKKNLNYMDYKVAHTTSKIVDPKLIKSVKSFKNVEELERHRGSIKYDMDEKTMREYQKKKELEEFKEMKRKIALESQEKHIKDHYDKVNMLFLGRKAF